MLLPLILGLVFFALGALVVWVNVYTSFVRYPLHRLRGGTRENFKWVSGIPLVGMIFLCVAAACFGKPHPQLAWTALGLILLDTGGPVGALMTLLYVLW